MELTTNTKARILTHIVIFPSNYEIAISTGASKLIKITCLLEP